MAEKTTSEAAKAAGISVELLRKYKTRGFLKLAPPGVPGQGRGIQCLWSDEAVAELQAFVKIPRDSKTRYPERKRS